MKRFHPEDGRYKCPDCESSNTVFIGAMKGIVVMECKSCGRRFKTEQKPMPPVDTVSVVRCADCVHCQYDAIYGDRWCDGRRVKPDGYCSYGKRKDLSLGTDNSEPRVELEPITGEYNRYHGELDVRNGKLTIYGSDRCVCCGAVVPEGRMVCPTCERRANND